MNKQLDTLVKNIEKNKEDIDTTENNKIKDFYMTNKSRAIELVIKDNVSYYYEIISDYKNVSEEFLLGVVLDSIYQSLEKYELGKHDKTYISISGMILKNKIINKIKHDSTKKKGGEETNSSFDEIKNKGYDFDNKSILNWKENLNGFSKFEMVDAIKHNRDLSGIEKDIAVKCVESEGKIMQEDLADELGVTQQAISYHLKKIRKNSNFM